jgi:hypothetical protein
MVGDDKERKMVKRSLVFLFGLAFALATQPALAASLSATAPSTVGVGETFSVDVMLDQAGGEMASLFEGQIELRGVAVAIDAFSPGGTSGFGPTWPNAAGNIVDTRALMSLTSNNTGGSRLLASLSVLAGDVAGMLEVVVPDAFAQGDLDVPPFVVDIPIDNLGAVLASIEVMGIPEPGTTILLGLGLASLVLYGRRRGEE